MIFVLTNREIIIRRSLQEVYEELGTDSEFVRVERGYIVNIEQIRQVGSKEITMETGADYISRDFWYSYIAVNLGCGGT